MNASARDIRETFALEHDMPPRFYGSLTEIKEAIGLCPYTHAMRRAWENLKLSGILCIDQRPTVYFKEMPRPDDKDLRDLHRRFWNHGTAPLLVVLTESEVLVFSALAYPARVDELPKAEGRIVTILNRTADILELRRLATDVETGTFYTNFPSSFSAEKNVDEYMLRNLRDVRDALRQKNPAWDFEAVHTLLGRIIFTCYLLDRDIIATEQLERAGAAGAENIRGIFNNGSPIKIRRILKKLFQDLQKIFNGSLFEDQDKVEDQDKADVSNLNDGQIDLLRNFLNGEDIGRGQKTFGFWVYDFSVIPIETISAMYEDFLAAEDEERKKGAESKDSKRATGAYYTKRHLAELVVSTALNGVLDLHNKRCLDPACGSGVFLVILFIRMAESWTRENPRAQNGTKARALIEILQAQLCGVDIKETACRITCFSLYLALLDQLKRRDIDELRERSTVLPDILALKRNQFQTRDHPVVFEANFFGVDAPIPKDFDIVIGNPPWVSRGKSQDTAAESWCESGKNPYRKEAPRNRAKRQAWFMPGKQIAHAFMWKTPLHLRQDGAACLLIPSKVLLNQTNEFQMAWFTRHSVDKIIQLADMSFLLFEHAKCPASIIRFSKEHNDKHTDFDFLAPKVDRSDPREDVITVLPEDKKELNRSAVIEHAKSGHAPEFWKRMLWGTPRDLQLLDSLLRLPTLESTANAMGWKTGEGITEWHEGRSEKHEKRYGQPKERWWDDSQLFIKARGQKFGLILTRDSCQAVSDQFQKLLWSRSPQIFQPPMVLVNQGFSNIAYCDFSVLFKHSIQSISGQPRDAQLLKFLAAYLRSKLATYYLFHTASNWGTERDKVHFFELLRLPFPQPKQAEDSDTAHDVISRIERIMDDLANNVREPGLGREQAVDCAQQLINPLIYDYFGLSEREQMLVEDVVTVYEPSSTPHSKNADIPTLKTTRKDERQSYADTLCAVLGEWAHRGPWRVNATCEVASNTGLALLTLHKAHDIRRYHEVASSDALQGALMRLKPTLDVHQGGLHHLLGLKVFDGPRIHILKSLKLREWTRTAALNDADEVASAILTTRERR